MTLDNALTGFLYMAMLAVVVVLITGIVNLYRGDEKARSRSNKLMRLRVVTQFVAILLLLVILYVRQNFGS